MEAGGPALDVQELLCPQISGEAGLGDCVLAELQGRLSGPDGVAAVGDAVNKGWGMLQGLDQVGFHGILKQSGHGALSVEVMGCDRLTAPGIGYHHFGQAALQIH